MVSIIPMNDHFKDITMQQIEALMLLIEEGSFSRAAKKMFLTQPAITKHIKNLEEALGIKVASRSNMGISLTPEGQVFYDYAKKILKLKNEAKDRILKLNQSESGSIHISASTIPATYILPAVLSGFCKDHSDIRIFVTTHDSEETLNRVIDNQAELGFVGKESANRKLHCEALWKDRLILAVPPNHPFRQKNSVSLNSLRKEALIIREKGSATRDIFEGILRERALGLSQFRIVGELGSSEAIKEAVLAGMGVSVISTHAIKRELAQERLFAVPIENCRIERNLYLIYRRQFDLMPYHHLFLEYVRNYNL